MGSESTGFKRALGAVVGEFPEARGGAAEVLEAPVDHFGRPLLVPGRSKNATTSAARCFRVQLRRRISTSAVETAERGQTGRGEDSVKHVEV